MAETYDMTWAEYCIKSQAYHRLQRKEWEKVRLLAWYSLVSHHVQDYRKLPKSIEEFMPLGDAESEKETRKKVTPEGKELHKQVFLKYMKEREAALKKQGQSK